MQIKEKLNNFFKKNSLLFFLIISMTYFEFIFHAFCFRTFNLNNIIYIFVFTLPITLLIYLLSTIFNEKINKILTFVFTIIFTIFFLSQFIYYDLFNAIYGLKSMGLINQVIVVFDKVIDTIIRNWYVIVLMLIPIIFLIIFNKKICFTFNKKTNTLWALFYIISFYAIGVLSIRIDKEELYCNYNLYYKIKQPILTTNNLGLTTEFGLEIYRTITNFSEKITIENTEQSVLKKEIKYNITDIDFDYLNSQTEDEDIILLNNFFKNRQATEQNEYTGLYKDKNLIFILAESLDKSIISEELTPTLYKLANESINFTNYYTPLYPGSTGSGEYMTEWGLIASNVAKSDQLSSTIGNYNPFRLNNSLKNLGYKTYAYHDYYGYFYNRDKYFKNDNYDKYGFCGSGVVNSCDSFRGSDLEMIKNTVDSYINEDKFFTYYVTVSGHGNYNYNANPIAQKNYNEVKNLDYSNTLKTYIAANKELDKALEYLLKVLEEKGKLENTVIVITPDHYPYYFKNNELNEVDTEDRTDKFLMHHENLIIWSQSNPDVKVDKYISNIDILPTILNLFGIEYDSRLFIGRDALSEVTSTVMLADQSWINENGSYDSVENKFTPTTNVSNDYISNMNQTVNTYFNISNLLQEKKYYTFLFDNKDKTEENNISS